MARHFCEEVDVGDTRYLPLGFLRRVVFFRRRGHLLRALVGLAGLLAVLLVGGEEALLLRDFDRGDGYFEHLFFVGIGVVFFHLIVVVVVGVVVVVVFFVVLLVVIVVDFEQSRRVTKNLRKFGPSPK